MREYVLTKLKMTKSAKERLSFRYFTAIAALGIAMMGLSCSEEKSAEEAQPVVEESTPAPALVATPVAVVKEVCLYEHKDYEGWEKCFTENQERFGPLGINDQVSSLKVKGGATAELYEHGKYGGFKRVYTEDTPWVGEDNDKFSSLKVK